MPPKKTVPAKTTGKGPTKTSVSTKKTTKVASDSSSSGKKTDAGPAVDMTGVSIAVKEIDRVLLRDEDKKIQESGKWPLVIDPTEVAATFLRHRDANYVRTMDQAEMETERLRRMLLGAIRYGKPLVLDMMDADMFNMVSEKFDLIQAGLMDSIMDKSLIKDEKYLSLVKEEDGEDYKQMRFTNGSENFSVIIITTNPSPAESLVKRTYLIKIAA